MRSRTATGNGYARLTSRGIDVLTAPEEGGVLFIDIDLGAADGFDRIEDAWRAIPPSVAGMCSQIALRSPVVRFEGHLDDIDPGDSRRVLSRPVGDWPADADALAEQVGDLLKRYRLPPRDVCAFELPVDGNPRCSSGATGELLARCRAAELESLLRRSSAIWEPVTYHYRLPSGDHAGSFVRIADAFTDRRAAAALASWLRGSLTESTVVVVDTGTLVPLIDQLALWIERAAAALPLPAAGLLGVETLDRYPRSRFQYLRQFKGVSDADVLAVLSVSSSGRTYRLLGQSLEETAAGHWRAECLVIRDDAHGAQSLPPVSDRGRQDAWLSIPSATSRGKADCPLCRDSDRARVVRIDPRTFGAMALPAPNQIMPDIAAAARNASLFDNYDLEIADAVAVQLAPTETSRLRAEPLRRAEQPQRVRFEPLAFLLAEDSNRRVAARIAELEKLLPTDPAAKRIDKALTNLKRASPTVVICDKEEVTVLAAALSLHADRGGAPLDLHEARATAEQRFLNAASALCPTVRRVVTAERGADLADAIGGDGQLLLFVAGLQTGVTLQHLVVQVQDAVNIDPIIHGLVLHAHPHNSSAWDSVRNTFGGHNDPSLLALWLTYLPPESPFVEEYDLLASAQDGWFADAQFGARERLAERLAWVRPDRPATATAPRPASPLWSSVPMRLRRTSRYGALDDRRCIAAVGAAVSESLDRHDSDSAPEWAQVDLPNAFRSYFDGVLHASLLRWVPPSRAWWGTGNECHSLIDELHGRFHDTNDWTLLLAELLLACAQGKLPDDGATAVMAHALQEMSDADDPEPNTPHDLGFVELGYILADRLLRLREERQHAAGDPR